ncbi:MAG: hypothetical protein AAF614_19165 [Chloroflexota bacterium]
MKFINHRLILAVLFGLIVFVASTPFGSNLLVAQTVSAQSVPADCTAVTDFSASVGTIAE